jgi:hypothetical protein
MMMVTIRLSQLELCPCLRPRSEKQKDTKHEGKTKNQKHKKQARRRSNLGHRTYSTTSGVNVDMVMVTPRL